MLCQCPKPNIKSLKKYIKIFALKTGDKQTKHKTQ